MWLNKSKNILFSGLIFLWASLCAAASNNDKPPITEAQAKEVLKWNVECEDNKTRCFLSKAENNGAIYVEYLPKEKKAKYVTVVVPPGNNVGDEIAIKFVKSVNKNGEWHLEPSGDMFGLPISFCDETSCIAKVHPELGNPDDLSTNMFELIKNNDFIWILYKTKPEPERAMVSLLGIREALEKI